MGKNKKGPEHGPFTISLNGWFLSFLSFSLKFFFDRLNIHVLNHRLEVLDFEGLTSNR
jgi:hypothetical protein